MSDMTTLETPLRGTAWRAPPAGVLQLRFTTRSDAEDMGMVSAGTGTVEITYDDGVRTDPARPPRTLAPGSVLSYAVVEVVDGSPLIRIAVNRAGA
jgi:hypothetical protein